MKIAIASQDLTRVDAHFGWARHLMIFDVTAEGHHLLHVHHFPGPLKEDGDNRKLEAKLDVLDGCSLVFVKDIGEEAIRRLSVLQIQAIRSHSERPVSCALDDLTRRLRTSPPLWLRREEQRHRRHHADDT